MLRSLHRQRVHISEQIRDKDMEHMSHWPLVCFQTILMLIYRNVSLSVVSGNNQACFSVNVNQQCSNSVCRAVCISCRFDPWL